MVKIAHLLLQGKELFEEQIKEKQLRIDLDVSPEISQNTDENLIADNQLLQAFNIMVAQCAGNDR